MPSLARNLSQSRAFNLLVVLAVIGLLMIVRLGREEHQNSAVHVQPELHQTGIETQPLD